MPAQLDSLKTKLKVCRVYFFFPKLKAEMMLCFKDLASYLINDKWYPACKTDNIRIQENNTNCF